MRRSILSLVVVLLFSASMLAQHSSGGGGGGGSSGSSSGGGGGHSGSSGGSSSSGGSGGYSSGGSSGHSSGGSGGHGSAGSVSHGSGSHGSWPGGSSSGVVSSHSGSHVETWHAPHFVVGPDGRVHEKTLPPEKRGVLSFLRHPFRREPKAPELRRWCFRGVCRTCPAGEVAAGGRCVGTVVTTRTNRSCRGSIFRADCFQYSYLTDDCSSLRTLMERQGQRAQAAEAERQRTCASSSAQECSDLTAKAQSEVGLYQKLQERFRLCQQRTLAAHPFGTYPRGTHLLTLPYDPLGTDLDHR